jgi:NADH-quinone oxidoreductase subunit D
LPDIEGLVVGNQIVHARTSGVGVLSREVAAGYGVSGPIARASGLDVDLRRDEPYLAYGTLFAPGGPGRVVTRQEGDALARLECLLEQVHVSLDLSEACIDHLRSLPPGPVNVRLPKVLRVPEGHGYCWTENPLGLNGYYLVSRGDKVPWRLKLRSASFSNVQVLSHLLPGALISDMVAIPGLAVLRGRGRRQVAGWVFECRTTRPMDLRAALPPALKRWSCCRAAREDRPRPGRRRRTGCRRS